MRGETCALRAKLAHLSREIGRVRTVVGQQADDARPWAAAETPAEAYLQLELRRLHAASACPQEPPGS